MVWSPAIRSDAGRAARHSACRRRTSPIPTISNINDVGIAHYDSLQIKAETKSAQHGLYALIGYTYSRNNDTGYSDGLGSNLGATYFPLPNWKQLDWGLSQINLNHDFTASLIYELPFGKGKPHGNSWSAPVTAILGNWELTAIQKVTSGFPVFVVEANERNPASTSPKQRKQSDPPEPGLQSDSEQSDHQRMVQPNCFVTPPAGELGNAPRTPLSGPGFVNTDFSAIKHFTLPWREGMRLDLRAEVFNLLNHPQFGTPGSGVCGACPEARYRGLRLDQQHGEQSPVDTACA